MKTRWISSRATSARMKLIPAKGSKIEKAFSRILRSHHIPYESHPKMIPGNPDFKIRGTNLLVFCDSSFWHGRHLSRVSKESFGENKRLWVEKLRRNARRDAVVTRMLKQEGYGVLRVWDDEIYRAPNRVVIRLIALLTLAE